MDSVTNFTIEGQSRGNGYMGVTDYIIMIIYNKKPLFGIYPETLERTQQLSESIVRIQWKDEESRLAQISLIFKYPETATKTNKILHDSIDRASRKSKVISG